MIAALYVATGGCYFGLPDVDPWDERRDARLYAGPWPVVAHPPCQRWGRYWGGGPNLHGTPKQKVLGDDGGCFAAALGAVERWGGVLEHPEGSHAWRMFDLGRPRHGEGWIQNRIGWTCSVDQGNYGHRSRKATWLLLVGPKPPELDWSRAPVGLLMDDGGRARAAARAGTESLSKRERAATPIPFRDLLLDLAKLSQYSATSTAPSRHRLHTQGERDSMSNEGTTTRKVYTEDERITVLKSLEQDINDAAIPGIKAEEVDYVIKKGKYKGTRSIICWVELEGQRILGYKFSKGGFLNLSFVLEGTSEETLQEVGMVAAKLMKLEQPIMPDDYTTFEAEFKKPEGKKGPRIDVAELQAKLARR